MNPTTQQLVGLIVLAFLSAFFSSSETALFSLGRAQRSQLKRDNPIFGMKVLDLLSQSSKLLAMILFCNLLINILIFSITARIMLPWLHDEGTLLPTLAVLIPIVAVLIVGEVLPKSIALFFPYRWSMLVAYPLSWALNILAPFIHVLVKFVPRAQEDKQFKASELESLVDETTREGELESLEGGLLKDLIRFGSLRVEEVMIPRAEMQAFQLSKGRDALKKLFESTLLTKIPVYHQTIDDTVGVIYLRDFVNKPQVELEQLIKTLPIHPEQMMLKTLYQVMRQKKQKTVLVVDEHGGTSGIITLKDILEEIIGEFNEDLVEEDPEFHWHDDGSCELSATISLRDFEELSGKKIKRGPYITLGGYLLESLGRIPLKNEVVTIDDLSFEISEVERSRMIRLKIRGLKKEEVA